MAKLISKLIFFISFILIILFFINSYFLKNKELSQVSDIEVKEENFTKKIEYIL